MLNGNHIPPFKEAIVIPLWSLIIMLVVMNTTMFNVSLPRVAADFALSATTASWIVTGYSILFAIGSITYSRLSDFLPIRLLLLIGLCLLGISSIIGMLSQSFVPLLLARLLQAAGAAAAPGLGVVLVTRYIPLERRGKAMSTIISAASLGFGLGPVVGGTITQYLGWNYLFTVTAIVLLFIPFFGKLLPKEPTKPVHFDIIGALLIGIGTTGTLLFLTSYSMLLLALGVASFGLLWWRINRIQHPFIQPSLLRNRRFIDLMVMGFSAYVIHFSTLFLMPIILVHLYGKGAAETGLLIFPGAILSFIAARYIGRIIDRYGNAVLIRAGHWTLLLATVCLALFSGMSTYAIMGAYIIMGTSVSALTTSVSNEMSRILDKSEIGAGMGMAQLTQFFGGAFGVALTGVSIEWSKHLPLSVSYSLVFWGMAALITLSLLVYVRYQNALKTVSANKVRAGAEVKV
ncbi:MFS transporter [Paenibacillus agricola]|uniref:MFS transporter n=1 Tax=Paenibacillus agricola TaxID=2716264 RepID=A0ABX0J2U5_9BACL|nr:MFS transporter [Paenibacillus agricola]NHN29143.1 MFS transporter [Paenibacillus agricola]